MTGNTGHEIWLGFSGLNADCREIAAIVHYQQAWDRRIVQAHGCVPAGVRSVVLLEDGRALPARRAVDELNQQWSVWRAARVS